MEIMDHPFLLCVALLLSLLGSWYLWQGLREKSVPDILLGFGLTIPTFGITDWRCWLAGGLICAVGYTVRNSIERL